MTSRTSGQGVAVIMRTKDRPLLLHRALASVLSQNYGQWRLYLVNDGGERAPLETLLELYRPLFGDRLTVIHHESSQGMEAASNAALRNVTEAFFVIHDDDDTWHPDFLSETVAFLTAPGHERYVAVATGHVKITEELKGGSIRELKRETRRLPGRGPADYGKMLKKNLCPPICLLMRSSLLRQIGFFDAAMPVLGDWDYNLRVLSQGEIGFIGKALACYHQRVSGPALVYNNTTVDHNDRHDEQNVLMRNRMLREAFAEFPALKGPTQALAFLMHDEMHELHERLQRIERVIFWQERVMYRSLGVWRRLMPLRRLIARLRGRV